MPVAKSYHKYKESGRCAECGTKLVGKRKGKTLCTKCAKKHTKYMAENILFFKEFGLCPRCGKERLEGQEKMCPECKVKGWIYGINYRNEHPEYLEKKYKKAKETLDYRRQNNLCTDCGTFINDERFKTCVKCRNKRRLAMQRYRKRIACANG